MPTIPVFTGAQDLYVPPSSEAKHPVVQWLYDILPESPPTDIFLDCKRRPSSTKKRAIRKRLGHIQSGKQQRGILLELSGNRRPRASPQKGKQKDRILASRPAAEPSTPPRDTAGIYEDGLTDDFEDNEDTPQRPLVPSLLPLTAATTMLPPRQPIFNIEQGYSPKKTGNSKADTSSRSRTTSPSKSDSRASRSAKEKETDLLALLRGATPSITCDGMLRTKQKAPIPSAVTILLKYLVEGMRERIIPAYLKDHLEEVDPSNIYGVPSSEYYIDRNLNKAKAQNIWEVVHLIYDTARSCQTEKRDENAWCFRVVLPLMDFAVGKPFEAMFEVDPIQTQKINSEYMPTMLGGLSIERKADFAWYFSPRNPVVQESYEALSNRGDRMILSQMKAPFKSHLALYCGVEVKTSTGDGEKGLAQLVLWLSAGLRKNAETRRIAQGRETWWKQRRAEEAQATARQSEKRPRVPSPPPSKVLGKAGNSTGGPHTRSVPKVNMKENSLEQQTCPDELPLFGWVVQGHRWSLYVAWLTNENGDT
ncbi:MAG: hypothetical protein Q9164_007382, partial [Protoblastenia rupestris]